jgi:hypothetical protein
LRKRPKRTKRTIEKRLKKKELRKRKRRKERIWIQKKKKT